MPAKIVVREIADGDFEVVKPGLAPYDSPSGIFYIPADREEHFSAREIAGWLELGAHVTLEDGSRPKLKWGQVKGFRGL